jgi:hypothetical protein
MEQDRGSGWGGNRATFWTFRWVMLTGSAAIAVVLLLRGNDLFGLLIGGLAVVRVAYLLSSVRRRRAVGPAAGAGAGREVLRRLARSEFAVAGTILGWGPGQVRDAFGQGRSLAEMATQCGVPVQRVVDAVVADASAKINQGMADGTITPERGRDATRRLPVWAGRLVNVHKGDLRRARSWS